ncbi:MAG: arabinose efflux permease family protein [Streptosporangiaceae bacterium]|nr:arabinose efflux permease family protein [Streptosporangiaceae bacterium]
MALLGEEQRRNAARTPLVQRRVLTVLTGTQVLGGLGVGIGVAVTTLLAASMSGSDAIGGLAQTSAVLGAALLAVPISRTAARSGRRTALTFAYGCGVAGALLVVLAATLRWWPLLLFGLLFFGGGSAAGLAARYAATDLSSPGRSARDLSTVVWATTVGSVAGPNLAEPADRLGRHLSLAEGAGPYVLAAVTFGLAAIGMFTLLRPDPLQAGGTGPRPAPARGGAWPALRGSARARIAIAGIVVSHTTMVAVMSMTPVHLNHGHTTLTVVGIVISLHITGMYALSPAVGWAADRLGRFPVLLLAMGQLAAAVTLASTSSPHDVAKLATALVLLGTGWSCGLVAGSALLTESIPVERRPAVQGLSDLLMNGAAAGGSVAGGMIVAAFSYGALAVFTLAMIVPMTIVLALGHRGGRDPRFEGRAQ